MVMPRNGLRNMTLHLLDHTHHFWTLPACLNSTAPKLATRKHKASSRKIQFCYGDSSWRHCGSRALKQEKDLWDVCLAGTGCFLSVVILCFSDLTKAKWEYKKAGVLPCGFLSLIPKELLVRRKMRRKQRGRWGIGRNTGQWGVRERNLTEMI